MPCEPPIAKCLPGAPFKHVIHVRFVLLEKFFSQRPSPRLLGFAGEIATRSACSDFCRAGPFDSTACCRKISVLGDRHRVTNFL